MANVGHSSTPRLIYARRSRIIGSCIRASPIEAVVLTGGEIDTRPPVCFSRRERSPFTLIATATTLAAVASNPMFGVLGSDVMWRRAITPGEGFFLGGGTNAERSSAGKSPALP